MPFAIQYYNPTYGTTLVYDHLILRKYSGRVTVPQLFCNKRPILYGNGVANRPKVTSQKWVCYCQDPTKEIYQHNVDDYDMGGYGNLYRIFPSFVNSKKIDNSSGLTISLAGICNNNGDAWASCSLRINRTSISTTYLNVFAWAWFANASMTTPNTDSGEWSNNSSNLNIDTANLYLPNDLTTRSGTTTNYGYIDGIRWSLVQRWGTITKSGSTSYLYVAAPWGCVSTSLGKPSVKGWGIILEPTNTKTY